MICVRNGEFVRCLSSFKPGMTSTKIIKATDEKSGNPVKGLEGISSSPSHPLQRVIASGSPPPSTPQVPVNNASGRSR